MLTAIIVIPEVAVSGLVLFGGGWLINDFFETREHNRKQVMERLYQERKR
jgi:hypothetical protein